MIRPEVASNPTKRQHPIAFIAAVLAGASPESSGAVRRLWIAVIVGAAYTLSPVSPLPPAGGEVSITVNSIVDTTSPGDGNCSLREAVENANRDTDITRGDCADGSGPDVIKFSRALAGQTISLRSVGDTTWGPSALKVSSVITIDGADAPGLKISQIGAGKRLFVILPEGELNINVTLQDGRANGGDGRGGGAGAGMGGAVFNEGITRVINSTLVGNVAVGGDGRYSSGGLCTSDNGGGPNGGAAGSPGFTNDGTAAGDGGNGGFQGGGGSGGCAYGGPAGDGGDGGFGGGGGAGGGNNGGGGTPGTGGAGGPFGADGSNGSSIGSGRGGSGAGLGGAIFNKSGIVIIHNSTFSGNVAQGGGFGEDHPYKDGAARGGAVFNYNGTLIVDSSTMSGNEVRSTGLALGGAVYSIGWEGETSSVLIENSILANSVADTEFSASDTISTGSHNIFETLSAGWGGSPVITMDPLLGPLTDNGGPTETMVPLPGSPALDAGSTGLATDQRGVSRPQGSADDIGSVEVGAGVPSGDFDGDGESDLVWRNFATGENLLWIMNGVVFESLVSLGSLPVGWLMAATADFDGNGVPDLVLRNPATGENTIWTLNPGGSFMANNPLGPLAGTQWVIGAADDFTGDDKPDLVWRNQSTGQNVLWEMNGVTFSQVVPMSQVTDTNWVIEGSGDFTTDTNRDLVWRNTVTTEVSLWVMNGAIFSSAVNWSTVPLAWELGGTGFYNGDTALDIVWRNQSTGQNLAWLMNPANPTQFLSILVFSTVTDLNWHIVGP